MHEIDYTYKKQSGGAGQYARVKLRISPRDPGSGFSFTNSTDKSWVPPEFVPGVEKAAKDLVGSMDFAVELLNGSYHDIDSSVLSFEIAGKLALTKAFEDMGTPLANPFVLSSGRP